MKRRVSVIVLCWNRWDLTSRCLDSIHRWTDLADVEVIAVDNGSQDETPERLRQLGWVRTIRSETNLGFVRGNNLGISAADPESDVVLLNNDTEILGEEWLERLQQTAHSAPDIGIVGCRLLTSWGALANAGTFILPDTCWGQGIGSFEMDVGQLSSNRDVQGIMFACAYLKKEAIQAVGLLSEEFDSYFEDTEYCLRAREAGFRTVCCGSVSILHHHHGSTANEPDARTELFEKSRGTFRDLWKEKLEARYRYDVHWQSVLGFTMGYATSGRILLRPLDEGGIRMSYSYVYADGTVWGLPEPADLGDYYLNVLAARTPARPCISVVYGLGNVFDRSMGDHRIGFTMLEVDGFPEEWVRNANQLDEVWVPSRSSRDAFKRSGLIRPVHVMPLGVDTEYFHAGATAFPNGTDDYVFLSVFEWNRRKAPGMLMRVFNETFSRQEGVVLVCKVTNYDQTVSVGAEMGGMRLSPLGGRIRLLVNRDIPYHQLPALYRSADCYVSAGHGEGWDLPLVEAMACGLPAIATDWGAHTDYFSDRVGFPLKIRGLIPAPLDSPYYAGFSWADPDPEHLSCLMRHVFEHRDEARELGQRAAEFVRDELSLRRAVMRMRARLDEIAIARGFSQTVATFGSRAGGEYPSGPPADG